MTLFFVRFIIASTPPMIWLALQAFSAALAGTPALIAAGAMLYGVPTLILTALIFRPVERSLAKRGRATMAYLLIPPLGSAFPFIVLAFFGGGLPPAWLVKASVIWGALWMAALPIARRILPESDFR